MRLESEQTIYQISNTFQVTTHTHIHTAAQTQLCLDCSVYQESNPAVSESAANNKGITINGDALPCPPLLSFTEPQAGPPPWVSHMDRMTVAAHIWKGTEINTFAVVRSSPWLAQPMWLAAGLWQRSQQVLPTKAGSGRPSVLWVSMAGSCPLVQVDGILLCSPHAQCCYFQSISEK